MSHVFLTMYSRLSRLLGGWIGAFVPDLLVSPGSSRPRQHGLASQCMLNLKKFDDGGCQTFAVASCFFPRPQLRMLRA